MGSTQSGVKNEQTQKFLALRYVLGLLGHPLKRMGRQKRANPEV